MENDNTPSQQESVDRLSQAALWCHEVVLALKQHDKDLRIAMAKELDLNLQRSLLVQREINSAKIATLTSVIEMLINLGDGDSDEQTN